MTCAGDRNTNQQATGGHRSLQKDHVMSEQQDRIPGLRTEIRKPTPEAVFPLGEISVQIAVRDVLPPAGPGSAKHYLSRHEAGDWGMLNRENADESWASAQLGGGATVSAYFVDFLVVGFPPRYAELADAGLVDEGDAVAILEVRTDLFERHTRVSLVEDPEGYYLKRCEEPE